MRYPRFVRSLFYFLHLAGVRDGNRRTPHFV